MRQFLFSPTGVVLIGLLSIAGYFSWTEHSADIVGYLPWALVAACPLMHLFMHHGHANHSDRKRPGTSRQALVPRQANTPATQILGRQAVGHRPMKPDQGPRIS